LHLAESRFPRELSSGERDLLYCSFLSAQSEELGMLCLSRERICKKFLRAGQTLVKLLLCALAPYRKEQKALYAEYFIFGESYF